MSGEHKDIDDHDFCFFLPVSAGIFRKSGDIQEINGEDDAQTEGRLASVTLGVLVLILLLPLNAL